MKDADKASPRNDELLSPEEVAQHLGLNRVTIYRWCQDGRLPCLKIGRRWRVRRGALVDFLRGGERPVTLTAQLRSFLRVPDNVIGIAQTPEMLWRLDAAFFRVGDARGGMLVKYNGAALDSADELRERFSRDGLDVSRLEQEGRFRVSSENDPPRGRLDALRNLTEEESGSGRTIWASFDWAEHVDLEEALKHQEALTEIVEARQLVVATAALERVAEDWPPSALREAQAAHTGMFWLSEKGLALSRVTPIPPD